MAKASKEDDKKAKTRKEDGEKAKKSKGDDEKAKASKEEDKKANFCLLKVRNWCTFMWLITSGISAFGCRYAGVCVDNNACMICILLKKYKIRYFFF